MRISELTNSVSKRKLQKKGFDLAQSLDMSQEIRVQNWLGRKLGQQGVWEGTPLCFAVEEGDLQLIRDLYANGADVNACNGAEDSPLFIAIREGRSEAVNVLLHECGADQSYTNCKYGRNETTHDVLDEGRARFPGHVGFFYMRYQRWIAQKDVNYDQTEKYLKGSALTRDGNIVM